MAIVSASRNVLLFFEPPVTFVILLVSVALMECMVLNAPVNAFGCGCGTTTKSFFVNIFCCKMGRWPLLITMLDQS